MGGVVGPGIGGPPSMYGGKTMPVKREGFNMSEVSVVEAPGSITGRRTYVHLCSPSWCPRGRLSLPNAVYV